MDIDRDAPVYGVAEIDVAAPLELAWKVQADLTSWPKWNPDVTSALTIFGLLLHVTSSFTHAITTLAILNIFTPHRCVREFR